VPRLATTILGARVREVFLARRNARPDDLAALHQFAACLGISVERVYELEASARRKLARALRAPACRG
jgi:DNA-directed RNA polymerase sigma subunit (sigma70/sigma32)